jgi:hypothetical protein
LIAEDQKAFKDRLAIAHNIFTANICQVGQSSKPQSHQLLIEWIELAQGRNMKQNLSKTADIPFKGTLGRNQMAKCMGNFIVTRRKGWE